MSTNSDSNISSSSISGHIKSRISRVMENSLGAQTPRIERGIVPLAYLLLSVLALFPLVAQSSSCLPDTGDSLHNIWTYGDDINRLEQGKAWYNASIFYPEKNSAILSEHGLINTVLFYPFYRWANNPILGYNFLVLLCFILCSFYTYLICYEFTKSRPVSFLAGLIFGFFPYRFAHLPHLQLLSFQWVLIPLYYLILYVRDAKRTHLLLFFSFFVLQVIFVGYNTIYLMILVSGYIGFTFLWNERHGKRALRRNYLNLVGALCVSLIVVTPFYLPYIEASSQGYRRSLNELEIYGVDLVLLVSAHPGNIAYGKITEGLRTLSPDGGISSVFPGLVVVSLTVLSLYQIIRLWKLRDVNTPSLRFFLMMGAFFFVMLFGPVIKFRNEVISPSPLFPVYKFIPLFASIRYIPNYIHPLMFTVSIIISYGLSSYKVFQRRKTALLLSLIIAVLICFEYTSYISISKPIPYGNGIPAVYQWLKTQPSYPLIELPVPGEIRSDDPFWYDQYLYVYYSIYHRMPIVNGLSGFFPATFRKTRAIEKSFPNPLAIGRLNEIGVRYVIVHRSRMPNGDGIDEKIARYPQLARIYDDSDALVLFLRQGADNATLPRTSTLPGDLELRVISVSTPSFVRPDTQVIISAVIENEGNTVWLADTDYESPPGKGEVRLAIRQWLRSDGYVAKEPDGSAGLAARGRLPHDVFPGERVEVRMTAKAPSEDGVYHVKINLVDELITWFPNSDLIYTIDVQR
jgi:hypothetical protein